MEVQVDVSGPGDGRRIIAENLGRGPRTQGALAAKDRPTSSVRPAQAEFAQRLAARDAAPSAVR
jgi:hypothetical protein